MFNKLKQFNDLRNQAKQLQSMLADEIITEEKNGVAMTMNGNLEMTGLAISDDMFDAAKKDLLQKTIKELHAEVLKKMQRTMAMKMKDMDGFPGLPGLS
jgi:DNA-binding protein YbaB